MPKDISKITKISGKVGDVVHVNSKEYGPHVRMAPTPGLKKNQKELKFQQERNGLLNGYAGELCRIIDAAYPMFKWPNLYHRILKRFKNEKENNRFLLLKTLQEMELNDDYKTGHKLERDILVTALKNNISITIGVMLHPKPGAYRSNSYFFELFLITWNKTKDPPVTHKQRTEWIYPKEGKPEFVFKFPRPAGTKHWLLLLRRRQGVNGKEIEAFVAEGIQVIDAGSFDKKDIGLLHKRNAEQMEKVSQNKGRPPEEAVPLVKAKRILEKASQLELDHDRHLAEITKQPGKI